MECSAVGLRLDASAAQVARSRGAIDLALGETLDALFSGDKLLQLSYSRAQDYARERLGMPPRTVFFLLELARTLADRPWLRRAVSAGEVTPRKALVVAPLATGSAERFWTAQAMALTETALRAAVRAAGKQPWEEFEAESLMLRMTPEQQDRLDAALSLARETLGFGAPRWQCLEAICQEWLGEFGFPELEEAGELELPPPCEAAVHRQLARIAEAVAVIDGIVERDALSLDPRALRLVEARRGYDEAFGYLARRITETKLWSRLGYRSLAEYCTERLGVSPRSVRERVWLERRMCALPELRDALSSGRLTYSKALLVAREASADDVAERIDEAASTTWQQLERESAAAEDRRNRAAGVRRLWGPKDAAQTMLDAILSAQTMSTERIDAGEALARIADHFVKVWSAHVSRPGVSRERREVLMRHGGLCAVPGCSQPAAHEHHIRFRSRGGSHDPANRLGVCVAHHLRGIHQGYLTVSGRAGERLFWTLGTGEVWETRGNDDTRRVS